MKDSALTAPPFGKWELNLLGVVGVVGVEGERVGCQGEQQSLSFEIINIPKPHPLLQCVY